MPEPFTSPQGSGFNTGAADKTPEQKLAELRKQNEEKAKQEALHDANREREEQHLAEQEQAKILEKARFAAKEERSVKPRSLRAIADDGNVLKAIDWILKRDPTEEEKDDFLRAVPRATKVDLVSARL